MKIPVTIEFNLADCFSDKGDMKMRGWEDGDIRADVLFDKWGYVRDEVIDPLCELIRQKQWSWMCEAVALFHVASNMNVNHYRFFKERK